MIAELVETLDDRHLGKAWANHTSVGALVDREGRTYAWLLLPSRNTWPTRHADRPAPTPGCGCAPCHRPRCCGVWGVPVDLSTGETVAWLCPTCLREIL